MPLWLHAVLWDYQNTSALVSAKLKQFFSTSPTDPNLIIFNWIALIYIIPIPMLTLCTEFV
jgi:hypothetical protein